MVFIVAGKFISSLVSPYNPDRVDDTGEPGEERKDEVEDEVGGAAGFDEDGEGWEDEGQDVEDYVGCAGGVGGVRMALDGHLGGFSRLGLGVVVYMLRRVVAVVFV